MTLHHTQPYSTTLHCPTTDGWSELIHLQGPDELNTKWFKDFFKGLVGPVDVPRLTNPYGIYNTIGLSKMLLYYMPQNSVWGVKVKDAIDKARRCQELTESVSVIGADEDREDIFRSHMKIVVKDFYQSLSKVSLKYQQNTSITLFDRMQGLYCKTLREELAVSISLLRGARKESIVNIGLVSNPERVISCTTLFIMPSFIPKTRNITT